jgi:serine/threonine-protein kinase PRP4
VLPLVSLVIGLMGFSLYLLGLLKSLASRAVLTPANASTPLGLAEPSLAPTPGGQDFDLSKQETDVSMEHPDGSSIQDGNGDVGVGAEVDISAADYDPTADMQDDREKRLKDADLVNDVKPKDTKPIIIEDEYEEVEIEEDEEDDDMDMFAAFGGDDQPKKKRKVTIRRLKNSTEGGEVVHRAPSTKPKVQAVLDVVDNADDTDGYYRITPGEILDDGRYQVTINLGKGMFSAVVKAKVLKAVDQERRQDVVGREVAIKVIRSQESM